MHGFAGVMIQFLEMRQADSSNVKLAACGLAERDTSGSQMVDASGIAPEKGRGLQVDEKTVHSANWEAGEPSDIGS